jgi:NAD+ synthetase
MRLALAQINTVVGDLDGNRSLILSRLEAAREQGADLVLFPELAVTGYPPEDLLLRPGFVRAAERSLGQIAAETTGIVALVGTPHFDGDLYNACAVCAEGEVQAIYHKRFLPNYGVFDEERYFASGRDLVILRFGEALLGLTVCEDMWQPGPPATDLALELGLRDYVEKNGFREIVIGLSGGIDSALTAALAVEALGPERVHGVSMPSRFSSEETRADARRLGEGLGIDFREVPIEPVVTAFEQTLAPSFGELDRDLTEENLQARARGVLLMALSNKFGWLVVATGNKSELSVGYSTLYGDMAGGFALLKDVFKTDVFRLARHLNERGGRELIPQTIIDRAPSAELRDAQLDEDSLPPYPALDRVLEAYVELDRSREELASDGFDPDVVDRALAMIDRAEYKRRQAPPGVKLRPKAFGRDRRTPITNQWRG